MSTGNNRLITYLKSLPRTATVILLTRENMIEVREGLTFRGSTFFYMGSTYFYEKPKPDGSIYWPSSELDDKKWKKDDPYDIVGIFLGVSNRKDITINTPMLLAEGYKPNAPV